MHGLQDSGFHTDGTAIFSWPVRESYWNRIRNRALSGGIQRICSRTLDHVPIDDLQEGDDIVAIARKAGIIDENTGRPLYLLLDRARNSGCRIIIADALDDEPYISSQLAPALEMTDQLVRGIELAKEAVGQRVPGSRSTRSWGIRR